MREREHKLSFSKRNKIIWLCTLSLRTSRVKHFYGAFLPFLGQKTSIYVPWTGLEWKRRLKRNSLFTKSFTLSVSVYKVEHQMSCLQCANTAVTESSSVNNVWESLRWCQKLHFPQTVCHFNSFGVSHKLYTCACSQTLKKTSQMLPHASA